MTRRPFWVRSAVADGGSLLGEGWTVRTLKKDFPGYMGVVSAYVSTLEAGCIPHEIHHHDDEEIFVLLNGELDLLTPDGTHHLGTGSIVYHPPGQQHTIRGASAERAEFLVFKWLRPGLARARSADRALVSDASGRSPWSEAGGIRRHRAWEPHPLAAGGTLVADIIEIPAQTGYPVHAHDHDLLLVLLQGQLCGVGHTTQAPAVVYYPAGTPHGASPSNPDPIHLIAFEFHRPPAAPWL